MKTILSILALSSLLAISCSKPAIQSSAAQSNAAPGNTNSVAKADFDEKRAEEILKEKVVGSDPGQIYRVEFGGLAGPFFKDDSTNTVEVRYKYIHRYPRSTTGGDSEFTGIAKFRKAQNGKWYLVWRNGDIEIK